jgi:superfamily I DNA and/or RNA helicase
VPLYRLAGRETSPEGITPLPKDRDLEKGQPKNANRLLAERYCVLGATPGGIYGAVKARWDKELFGHAFCECLVLDEASQMNLPEAVMAALPLALDGQLIVVGDHRQMPPIVKHDWDHESRRTFQEYRAYESLFQTLLPLDPPVIRFAESFRLHHDLAAFLREEIYRRDGIPYHSRRVDLLPAVPLDDPFVRAVLSPEHPLVVVVHDEAESQARNPYEQALISPLLEALSDPDRYGLDAADGLGVVVPHRAQRAALQSAFPLLCELDPESGSVLRSAVDTVERFQGGERTAILVSATESDREYLQASSEFLLDPRRLTVAMSRAKRKLVLVASRSVFTLLLPDEETFQNSQLWKNLLRRTCTEALWQGERDGRRVEVWGNAAGEG